MHLTIWMLLGFAGGTWWIGADRDAPKPGDWWGPVALGIAGAIGGWAAGTMTGASLDTAIGIAVGLAGGKVASVLVGAVLGMRKG